MSRRLFRGSLRSRTLPAFGRGTCPEGASDFSPTERLAEWGSGPSGPRGRGPEDRHQSTVVSWLASLAHPPGLRPGDLSGGRFGFLPHGAVSGVGEWPVRAEGARSGGPPSVDGGFVARFARAPSRPSAVLPRSTAVSRGRSPLRSRLLPAFGRTPPFHFRFTGEKSAS